MRKTLIFLLAPALSGLLIFARRPPRYRKLLRLRTPKPNLVLTADASENLVHKHQQCVGCYQVKRVKEHVSQTYTYSVPDNTVDPDPYINRAKSDFEEWVNENYTNPTISNEETSYDFVHGAVITYIYASTASRVIPFRVPPEQKLVPPTDPVNVGSHSFAFKVLSHVALSGGTAGTWGATNGATLFVKKDAQVLYTGTNPSREFDTTEGWKSNYRTVSGFLGVKFNWFALGGEFESFTMVPQKDRFTMENTKYGIAVSLPTVDIKGTVFSLRGEVRIAPKSPLSPYIALSYPVAHSLKSQGYNSDPEPKEVKNEAWTIYGVNVTPYKNMKIPAAFSPAFELGFGIRLKGSLRLRISAKYRRLDWNLFYHKHQDEVILIGANVSI